MEIEMLLHSTNPLFGVSCVTLVVSFIWSTSVFCVTDRGIHFLVIGFLISAVKGPYWGRYFVFCMSYFSFCILYFGFFILYCVTDRGIHFPVIGYLISAVKCPYWGWYFVFCMLYFSFCILYFSFCILYFVWHIEVFISW